MSTSSQLGPKRRASSNSSQKQQTTLLQAFSNSKKAKTDSPMLIDLTKAPASPSGRAMGGLRPSAKKMTIRNPTSIESSAREREYYERTFNGLVEALNLILGGGHATGVSEYNRGCENLVRGGQADRCAKMATDRMTQAIKSSSTRIAGQIAQGEQALKVVMEFSKTWNRQVTIIRSILFYLDRTYLIEDLHQDSIADIGRRLLRTQVLLHEGIQQAFIHDVQVEFDSCRDMKQFRTSIWLNEVMQLIGTVKVYEGLFEPHFLHSSTQFFKTESTRLSNVNITERLQAIVDRTTSETEMGDALLRPSTKSALLLSLKQELIKVNAQELVHGFDELMDKRDEKYIKQLYSLLKSVDEVAPLRLAFANHVKKAGMEILSDKLNDRTMVESLLAFKQAMDGILVESFDSEDLFAKALRDQFASFINSRGDIPAEMMAKFIDSVLRSGNKKFDEGELEVQMSRLMDIFRFIASKDVFEAFYKKDLAKRLLLNKSASSDAERSLLAKLKIECGPGFTHKLEGMFKDVDISRDYGKNFVNKSLDVFVLSQGSWPTYPEVKVKLPEIMSSALQEYQDYYLRSNNGRKLMWRHSLGHCQIRARFPKGDKDLMVSLFQGLVLLLFDDSIDSLPYQDIKEATGLDDKELSRTLQSLACGKPENRVLIKSPKGKDVNTTDIFKVNESFQNPKRIVKINQIQMKETAEENQATHERVIQDRSFEIQAAIIRIMKAAKKKTHAELIAATIDTVKGRGIPNVPDIKKAIEKLLDREYLSRHDKEYHYEA